MCSHRGCEINNGIRYFIFYGLFEEKKIELFEKRIDGFFHEFNSITDSYRFDLIDLIEFNYIFYNSNIWDISLHWA